MCVRANIPRRFTADRRDLEKVRKSIKEIVAMIEDGIGNRTLIARLSELEAKEAGIQARLDENAVDTPDVHPNVAGIYRREVERLAEALGNPNERYEVAKAIRSLVEPITLTPRAERGQIDAPLHGDFRTIPHWAAQQQKTPGAEASGVSFLVVAGARNHRDRHTVSIAI